MIEIRKVTVLGTRVLGSQIAFKTASKGFDVTAYDISDAALDAARGRVAELSATYKRDVSGATDGLIVDAAERIWFTVDLDAAMADADCR